MLSIWEPQNMKILDQILDHFRLDGGITSEFFVEENLNFAKNSVPIRFRLRGPVYGDPPQNFTHGVRC